ncbi:hypothetical protein [Mycobacteroides abscessus]|uniref:hypothetical protein n=1 Tax=Mycobacteroides abscessus TaxID=36809 RepID=UPI00138FF91F|nr:hypothetical protein [Mycobacteroides abscessus]
MSDRDDVHPEFPQRSGLFIDSCPFRSRPHDRQREAKPRSWIFPPDMRYTPRLTPGAGTFRHRVVESMRYITFPVKACANAYVAGTGQAHRFQFSHRVLIGLKRIH